MSTLDSFVACIRRKHSGTEHYVPGFDPDNGNGAAKYLLVLEAPGPTACETGVISLNNPDQTASNLKEQLDQAGIQSCDMAIWNVVPWYVGDVERNRIRAPTAQEVLDGIEHLKKLVSLLPNLQCIVLVGASARRAHIPLSATTNARILACHHPSPRALNTNRRAADENVAVFKKMNASFKK